MPRPRLDDLTDRKFGDRIVLTHDVDRSRRTGVTYWFCRCKCGGVHSVGRQLLVSGGADRCKRCTAQVRTTDFTSSVAGVCPVCADPFDGTPNRVYCSPACRKRNQAAADARRRKDPDRGPVRWRKIAELVAAGWSTVRIAVFLKISPGSVTYALAKLGRVPPGRDPTGR